MGGTEMMVAAAIKALGLDPEEIKKTIAEVAQIVFKSGAALGRIEAQQKAILENQKAICDKLEIPFQDFQPPKGNGVLTHARSE